jgi:hypothetical protein
MDALDEDQAHRAMDLLVEADTDEFRRFGKPKDSRPDLPPDRDRPCRHLRRPLLCVAWHTNDNSILPEVKDGLRWWRLGRVVTVVDRELSSDANLDHLRRAGGHWIAGEKMRYGSADAHEVLARQGRHRQVRGSLRVKEVRLDTNNDDVQNRWIICHNPYEAERDQAKRAAAIGRVTEEFARIDTAGTVAQTTPLTAAQQAIVDACGVAAPPRVTHLNTT